MHEKLHPTKNIKILLFIPSPFLDVICQEQRPSGSAQYEIWGVLRQNQVSRAGTANYILQYLWDVITYSSPDTCLWHNTPQLRVSLDYVHLMVRVLVSYILRKSMDGHDYSLFDYFQDFIDCWGFPCIPQSTRYSHLLIEGEVSEYCKSWCGCYRW